MVLSHVTLLSYFRPLPVSCPGTHYNDPDQGSFPDPSLRAYRAIYYTTMRPHRRFFKPNSWTMLDRALFN